MKKKYIIIIIILFLLNNLTWISYHLWNNLSWNIQYTSSVDYASELAFALGYDCAKNKKWSDEAASSSRLVRIKTDQNMDIWNLPTNRGYILKIQKETNGMIANVFVEKR